MAISSLGSFVFVSLVNPAAPAGAPILPMQQTEIEDRPGVDGISVLLTGEKGVPFTLIGSVDVDDRSAAEALLENYAGLAGEITTLVWNGINYAAVHGVKVIVLSVGECGLKRINVGVGGFSSAPQYWVTSVWNLVCIRI